MVCFTSAAQWQQWKKNLNCYTHTYKCWFYAPSTHNLTENSNHCLWVNHTTCTTWAGVKDTTERYQWYENVVLLQTSLEPSKRARNVQQMTVYTYMLCIYTMPHNVKTEITAQFHGSFLAQKELAQTRFQHFHAGQKIYKPCTIVIENLTAFDENHAMKSFNMTLTIVK